MEFRWPEEPPIPSTAIQCFATILHKEQFCDVTFLVGPSEEKVKAHWENSDIISLPQFEPQAFRSFLKVITERIG